MAGARGSPRPVRSIRDDRGNGHVLSAMLASFMMLGGVYFAMSWASPGPAAPGSFDRLEDHADNLLSILESTGPVAPGEEVFESRLDQLIAEAMVGDPSSLRRWTNGRTSPAFTGNFYLQTRVSQYPLLTDGVLPTHSEVASAQRSFLPTWSATLPISDLRVYDGFTPMSVHVPSMWRGNIPHLPGADLRVTAFVGNEGTMFAKGLTAASGSEALPLTLTFVNDGEPSAPIGAQDRRTDSLNARSFALQVRAPIGIEISSGIVLEVVLPNDWRSDYHGDHVPGWSKIEYTAENGWLTVRAELNSDGCQTLTSAGSLDFDTFLALSREPTEAFHIIEARLYNGSLEQRGPLAQASLIMNYAGVPTALRNEFEVTAPYLMSPGNWSRFGFAFANADPQENATVTQIKIEQLYGKGLFHDVRAVAGANGAMGGDWNVSGDGRTIWWNHSTGVSVAKLSAADWWVDIQASENTTAPGAGMLRGPRRDYVNATVEFEDTGYETTAWRWRSGHPWIPGVEVPPANVSGVGGYNTSQGTHTIRATRNPQPPAFSGTGEYRVWPGVASSLLGIKAALAKSHIALSDYEVPVGDYVDVSMDVRALLSELADKGVSELQYRLKMYSPPGLVLGRPSVNLSVAASALPVAPIRGVAVEDITGEGAPDYAVASGDGNTYLLDGLSRSTLWASPVGTPTAVAWVTWLGHLLPHPVTGTLDGSVLVHDPATGIAEEVATAGGRIVRIAPVTVDDASVRTYVEFASPSSAAASASVGPGGIVALDEAGEVTFTLSDAAVPQNDGRNMVVGRFLAEGATTPVRGVAFLNMTHVGAYDEDGVLLWSKDITIGGAAGCTSPSFITPWDAQDGVSATRILVIKTNPAQGTPCIQTLDGDGDTLIGTGGTPLEDVTPILFAGVAYDLGTGIASQPVLVTLHDSAAITLYKGSTSNPGYWTKWRSHSLEGELPDTALGVIAELACSDRDPLPPYPLDDEPPIQERDMPGGPNQNSRYATCMGVVSRLENLRERRDPLPTTLLVTDDRVTVGYAFNGGSHVAAFEYTPSSTEEGYATRHAMELSGRADVDGPVQLLLQEASLAGGPWLLVAGPDGNLTAASSEDLSESWIQEVGRSLGRFTFRVQVPKGGLFGAHLVVVEVAWTVAAGPNPPADLDLLNQAARFVAPFTVVDPKGREILLPAYTVVLLQWERGAK